MKVIKITQILVLGLGVMLFFSACGEKGHSGEGEHSHETHAEEGHDHEAGHDSDQGHAAHGEGVAYTSAYVCPMHCEGSGSEEAGECPVCGMTYVAQADHVADGHNHMEKEGADHDHEHGENHEH